MSSYLNLLHKSASVLVKHLFPCDTCAHIAVSKVLLNESKLSSTVKKVIALHINKSDKKMDCYKGKRALPYTSASLQALSDKEKLLYDSNKFKNTKLFMEKTNGLF